MIQSERRKFRELFDESKDGSLTPKTPLEINGVVFSQGVTFQKGVAYGGIDFHLYKYRDIAVQADDMSEGPVKILGFYQD
ncbi:MAG TPA: hypothetical protein VJH91_00780 [Candidatus Paceibacterota bacterium]